MSSARVIWVDLETFAHATEDTEKVFKSLLFLLPDGLEKLVKKEKVLGHYRNEIIILKIKITNKKNIEDFLSLLSGKMDEKDKELLFELLDKRLDDSGTLYIRFDKQKAFLGELKLSDGEDVIRIRIKFSAYPLSRELVQESCLGYGLMKK
ncbi:MAG: RNA-binding domain-containing protein [Candidatus Jordarchaeum sp.]|uniref:RNA-binding domain-containing protein n=1 Tax=Candidatus Jordarchaeum sp. TaxID=2823881 RepID=UPI00404B456D